MPNIQMAILGKDAIVILLYSTSIVHISSIVLSLH